MLLHGKTTTAVLALGYTLIVAGFVWLAVEQHRLAAAEAKAKARVAVEGEGGWEVAAATVGSSE
jgi:hypothetical protein